MRAVADVTRGVVHAEIEIAGPPEAVFDALTDPQQLATWWGGELYRTFDWQLDVRPGGAWSVNTQSPTGAQRVYGEFLRVEPPRRLSYTWHASWDGFARTEIHYELEVIPSGTRVRVVHEGFTGRPASCEGHAQGWDLVLGWLGAHVARR